MTIRKITIPPPGPEAFVGLVTSQLAGRALGDIVSLQATSQEITVRFQKLGTSELSYALTPRPQGDATSAQEALLAREKIALTHRAFRSDIEAKLKKVLIACGAKVTEG